MSSKVVVNGRFAAKRLTGVQRYAREIVDRLSPRCDVVWTDAQDGMRGHRWEQAMLPLKCRGRLLWSPCNTGPILVRNQVVTIHDTSFIDAPECFGRAFLAWYRWLIPRLARAVRRVMTVSEFSRQRIAELANIPLDRIDVVHNGVNENFRPAAPDTIAAVRNKFNLHGPYILTLGSLEPRKNLATLLKAWPRVSERHGDLTLAIAGGSNLSIFANIPGLASIPHMQVLGYVADELLPALYSGAEAFVFPSVYEGFGLPPLEAMACGTPVVCANTTALPEVVGNDAVLIDPRDAGAIADAVLRLLDDSALRRSLAERGTRRAGQFTWESAADKTWDVLNRAMAMS